MKAVASKDVTAGRPVGPHGRPGCSMSERALGHVIAMVA